MIIRWLGTATIEIECGSEHILIDPYFQKKKRIQNELIKEALNRADQILITHPHLDHFSDVKEIVSMSHCDIHVAERGIEIAESLGVNCKNMHAIHNDDEIRTEEILIRVWKGKHIVFDRKQMISSLSKAFLPWNFMKGVRLGLLNRTFSMRDDDIFDFEIICRDKRVFVMGSANLCEDVAYPRGMDCLVFPYQGRSDLDTYAIPLLERLQAKKIVLSHFDDAFPPISSSVKTDEIMRHFSDVKRPSLSEEIEI